MMGKKITSPVHTKNPEQLRVSRNRLTDGSGASRLGKAGWAETALPNTPPGDPGVPGLGSELQHAKEWIHVLWEWDSGSSAR